MAYEDDYDRLKPKQPKPELVTGKFPTERFVGKILTSSPVANTYVRVQPVELFGTEEEGQSVSPTAKNREVVAALFDDAVKGAYVIVGRVRHRYVIEGVIGVDWNEGGGSMLERCRCQDTPYEIEKECGSCGPRYEYDPCEGDVAELPRIMPRILRVRVNTIAEAEGEDCEDCSTHKGDVIELENVPDEYGDPTCTWAGVGPHCQNLQLAIGDDDAVLSYLGEDGSCIEALLSVPVASFNCCGTTTGWEGTEGDTCTMEVVVEPHPCTCCPAESALGFEPCEDCPETEWPGGDPTYDLYLRREGHCLYPVLLPQLAWGPTIDVGRHYLRCGQLADPAHTLGKLVLITPDGDYLFPIYFSCDPFLAVFVDGSGIEITVSAEECPP